MLKLEFDGQFSGAQMHKPIPYYNDRRSGLDAAGGGALSLPGDGDLGVPLGFFWSFVRVGRRSSGDGGSRVSTSRWAKRRRTIKGVRSKVY